MLAILPQSFHVERRLETATRIEGSEAATVAQELAERFRSPFVHPAVLVVQGLPPADSAEGTRALTQIVAALQLESDVSGIISYLSWPDPLLLGSEGRTLLVVGLGGGDKPLETLIPRLRSRMATLRQQFHGRYPAVSLELTGETPLNFDLRALSAGNVRDAELRVLPATLLLLLVAFRSLVAAVLPLGIGLLAISMTLGGAAFLADRWHLSILIQNVATMLGLGLGIDYALLVVSRFREALGAGHSSTDAADLAARRAGHTLLVSALTVAIGFAALLTVPISEIRSVGVAGFLIVGASALLATSLLPTGLAALGARINFGPLRLRTSRGQDSLPAARQCWRRWGRLVTRNPWLALLLAGIPLLLLASQALRLEIGLPRGDWLPPAAESVRALHSLESMERAGVVESLRVILELPPGSTVDTDTGWGALSRLSTRLAGDRRAERVISLSTLTAASGGRATLSFLPDATVRSYLRSDRRATLLEVLPAAAVSPGEQIQWVRELRRLSAAALTGVAGASMRIGGIPALNADYDAVVRERLPKVMALVIAGSFLALLLGFRSVFVSMKAITLNLLSVAAAFGALVVVFQDGHGSSFIGVSGATGSVFPIVPILTFAVVFGLSMDYEVFLVARVLEARRSGLPETEAIVEGVARTSGLITSAAAIMVVVFAAFTFGGFMLIKMLGFTLATAVLIDATLVRMAIGPALLCLAGDWNWWPWGLAGPNATKPAAPGG